MDLFLNILLDCTRLHLSHASKGCKAIAPIKRSDDRDGAKPPHMEGNGTGVNVVGTVHPRRTISAEEVSLHFKVE